jgi:hypothetical protein
MCDDDGINECTCVPKGTSNTGNVLDNEKQIEEALRQIGNVGKSVLFGFVDGFLGGLATDLNEAWKNDKKCQDGSEEINENFKKKPICYIFNFTFISNNKYGTC